MEFNSTVNTTIDLEKKSFENIRMQFEAKKNLIFIEGLFDGNLTGLIISRETICIKEKSEITGNIICKELIVSGKFHGNIYCTGKVITKSNSEINGKIFTKNFLNEDNCNLNCTIYLVDKAFQRQIDSLIA
jgi:cytoskeletal protein CcmA (bactofilin family)